MSQSTDPTPSDDFGSVQGTHHEIRRRGRVFGFEYDVGIHVTELSDLEMERSSPPLLPGPRRLALPGAAEGAEAPATAPPGSGGNDAGTSRRPLPEGEPGP